MVSPPEHKPARKIGYTELLHCKNGGVHSTLKLLHTTGVLLLLVCTAHSGVCGTPIVMVWSLLWCARHTTL